LPSMGGPASAFPPDFGYSLATAYAVWVALVFVMYPLCRRAADFKARTRASSVSYL